MAAASSFVPIGGASSPAPPAGFRHRHDNIPARTTGPRPMAEAPGTATKKKIRRDHRPSTSGGWSFQKSGWVKEGFRQFGEHCARNQARFHGLIRTLLIDCLVMTNLFYPALAVYLQKRDPHPVLTPSPSAHLTHQTSPRSQRHKDGHDPLAVLTSPLLDNLFPYPPPLLPRLSWGGWWGRHTGQESGAGWIGSQVKQGDGLQEEEIWLMRVAWADVGDILDGRPSGPVVERPWNDRDELLLNFVRETAEDWEGISPGLRETCVGHELRSSPSEDISPGSCYILSPGNYLSNQSTTTLANLLDFPDKDHPGPAYPTVPNAVWGSKESSIYRSVAVAFRIARHNSSGFEDRWSDAVGRFTRDIGGEVYIEAEALRRDLHDWVGRWSVSYYAPKQFIAGGNAEAQPVAGTFSSRLIVVVFFVLIAALSAQISFATKVHSRFGLAFTGIVQLCCSSVMSLSILALLGWNGWGKSEVQTTLPTYILPFVIVVVGVENMSTLVKAVFSVPFSYSVPVRIGLGLAKVGKTIALTSLTDLLLLGAIWLCVNLRPVREFCLFAAVVIITDWFMLHTFFLTVLSIDAQRLELADVLAGNGGVTTVEVSSSATAGAEKSLGKGQFDWRSLLRARMTKSFSLVLLLLVVVALFYQSERQRGLGGTTASLYGYNPSSTGGQPGVTSSGLFSSTTTQNLSDLSTGERFWRAINPHSVGAVRVVIPAATILALPRPGHSMSPGDIRNLAISPARLFFPRLKPFFFFFKIMILPQAATAGALYGVLLFLLKDSELLDAQRNKLGRGEADHPTDEASDALMDVPIDANMSRVADQVNVRMLPGSHPSDIDLVASSRNGRTVVSVGVDNTIFLWRLTDRCGYRGTREALSARSLGSLVVAVAVSDDGKWIAIAGSGRILAWEVLPDKVPVLQPILTLPSDEGSRIDSIAFFAEAQASTDSFALSASSPILIALPPISVSFVNGKVAIIQSSGEAQTIVGPSSSGSDMSYRLEFGRSDNDGHFETGYLYSSPTGSAIRKSNMAEWNSSPIESTVGDQDPVTVACARTAYTREGPRDIIALGHRRGTVELLTSTGGLLATIGWGPDVGPVVMLDIGAPATCRCSSCGSIVYDSFIVVSATSQHVFVDHVRPRSTILCRCSIPRRSHTDEAGRSSIRSTPSKAGLAVPPMLARGCISPGSSPRKSPSILPPTSNGDFPLSSHGAARRMSNMSNVGNVHRDEGGNRPPSPDERPAAVPMSVSASANPTWQEYDVQPLGAISVPTPSSSWAIISNSIVGVRRNGKGIDDSQWQIWTIDLSAPWNGHSLNVETASLSHLAVKTHRSILERAISSPSGVSIQDRRAERMLSMIGRSAFPSLGSGSITVPTHPPLAYVSVRPYAKCGESIVAGFGNRLGIISLPEKVDQEGNGLSSGALGKRVGNVDLGVRAPPPKRSFDADVERKRA